MKNIVRACQPNLTDMPIVCAHGWPVESPWACLDCLAENQVVKGETYEEEQIRIWGRGVLGVVADSKHN